MKSFRTEVESSYRALFFIFVVLFTPSAAFADAILPSLFIVWPIAILLFVPVVLIEAIYAQVQLRSNFWRLAGVTTVANLLSAIVGLPLATVLSAGFKYTLETLRFHDTGALRTQEAQAQLVNPGSVGPHDSSTLIWLGIYPKWIMILSAVAMMLACYLISWWIEGKWLQRYLKRHNPDMATGSMRIAMMANLLSYGFLTLAVVVALLFIWPARS